MKIPSPDTPGQAEIPEVPEEAARYLEKYFTPRDKTISDIVDALQGRLSPKDNNHYERRAIYLLHGSPTRVMLDKVKHPFKVEVEWQEYADHYKFRWDPIDQQEVEVTVTFDSDPGALSLVYFGIWGD